MSGVLIWGTHSLSQAQIKTSGSQSPTNPRLPGPRIELSAPVKSSFSERSRLKVSGTKDLCLLPLCPLSGQHRPGHVAACSQCANLMSCLGNPQVPTKKSRRKNKHKSPKLLNAQAEGHNKKCFHFTQKPSFDSKACCAILEITVATAWAGSRLRGRGSPGLPVQGRPLWVWYCQGEWSSHNLPFPWKPRDS